MPAVRPLAAARPVALALALLFLVAGAARPAALAASPPGPPARAVVEDGLSVPRAGGPRVGGIDPDERLSLMVHLDGPALWDLYRADRLRAAAGKARPMATTTLEALRAAQERRQAAVAAAVEATGARVVDRYQVSLNALLVHASRTEVPAIAAVAGVVGVGRAPVVRIALADSVPHVGAKRVAEELGFDGAGATVAIIDTGFDYTHGDFGGPGTVEAYNANDENVVEPGSFPTEKFVGGFDLAGQHYSPFCGPGLPADVVCTDTPTPDDDPLDPREQGHGTHVAGIVAGEGVAEVSPGVAPGARLVGLKAFGSPIGLPGGNATNSDLVVGAIDWVARHNMGLAVPGAAPPGKIDVINMSLGGEWSEWARADFNRVVDVATEAGVTVVVSAGNSGPTPYIVGAPSTADKALSVASSYAPGEVALAILARWQEAGQAASSEPAALEGGGWMDQLADTGAIEAPLAFYGLACSDEAGEPTAPAQDVAEKIALIARGTCVFYDKVWNAAKLGAVGVVVFSDTRPKTGMGCGPPSDCENGPQIPGVMIDQAPGLELQALLEAGTAVTVKLDPEHTIALPHLTDTISEFSSRGPSRVDGSIKPQVTAPGSNIVSAMAGSGSAGVSFSGTSMSGPTVAGVAALLWQRARSQALELEALDVSALIMNTAQPVIKIGRQDVGAAGAVARQGAGRADAWRAATGGTLVRSGTGIADLGFGTVHVGDDPVRLSRTLRVRNLDAAPKAYRADVALAFPEEDAGQGVGLAVEPAAFTVAGGESKEVVATLTVDPGALRPWLGRGTPILGTEPLFQELEVDGHLHIVETDGAGDPVPDGDAVGVPFHALPRRDACVRSSTTDGFALATGAPEAEQAWSNPCGMDGVVEPAIVVGRDPLESVADPSVPARFDIEAVGLRTASTDPETPGAPTMLEFLVHTRGVRRAPIEAEFDVFVDVDRDGVFDSVVFNGNSNYIVGGPPGAFVVASAPLVTGTLQADLSRMGASLMSQAYMLDESTAVLGVVDADLGLDLSTGAATFDFFVVAQDLSTDFPLTATYLGYDVAPNGGQAGPPFTFRQSAFDCLTLVDAAGAPAAGPGTAITVPAGGEATAMLKFACGEEMAGGPASLLMAYPENGPEGTRADIRPGFLGRARAFLPLVLRDHVFGAEVTP